jgi:superoxide reductase
MANRLQVFKCEKCGSIVEVLHEGHCDPSCCGQPMKAMVDNTTDAAKEKHVPVLEKLDGGWKVTVGSVPHPMEAEHYIEWIEFVVPGPEGKGEELHRRWLKPGEKPEAFFPVKAASAFAREYCNKHGLWKA